MKNMNKKYINLAIIGLMILILVIAGLMDYRKGIDEDINNIDLENIDDAIKNENEENVVSEEVPNENTNPETTATPKPVVNPNTVKFNTALSNGSTAFNAKEYDKAITYFDEALTYNKSDVVYVRLFSAYSAKGNWTKALEMIDQAISVKPSYTDYWIYKLVVMDEKTNATFSELKNIYVDGLTKVDPKTKINLMTNFARIAENNGDKSEAISIWTKAQTVYPENKTVYQAEINRLNK